MSSKSRFIYPLKYARELKAYFSCIVFYGVMEDITPSIHGSPKQTFALSRRIRERENYHITAAPLKTHLSLSLILLDRAKFCFGEP